MSLKPVESKLMKGANQESGLPTRDSVIQIDRSSSRLEYHWKTSQVGEMTHCHRTCSYFAERNAVLRSKTPKLVPKMLYLVVVYRVTINDVRWQKGPCNEANQLQKSISPRGTRSNQAQHKFHSRQTICSPRNTFVQSRDARNFSFFASFCQRGNIAQLFEWDKVKQVSAFAVGSLPVFTTWKIPGRRTLGKKHVVSCRSIKFNICAWKNVLFLTGYV